MTQFIILSSSYMKRCVMLTLTLYLGVAVTTDLQALRTFVFTMFKDHSGNIFLCDSIVYIRGN